MKRIEELRLLKESSNTSEPITIEDREFMKQMAKRMPNLSVWHNAERSEKLENYGDDQLSGGVSSQVPKKMSLLSKVRTTLIGRNSDWHL